MPYAIREALAAFRRTPLLMAISIVAVSLGLFVVGLFGLTAFNIRMALLDIEDRVELVAYLYDEAPVEEVERISNEFRRRPEVLDLHYVSKEEALSVALQDFPEFSELFSGLDANPLPAALEIHLQPGYRTPEIIDVLARELLDYSFVEEAQYGRDWVARIVSLQRIAAGATLVIGGAFAAVAGIIIATAVRIAVYARREEIEVMRLVGATDAFIRRPFIIEGLLAGLAGGAIAVALTFLAHRIVDERLVEISWLPSEWIAATLLIGALYGVCASTISVRRHLRTL